MLHASLASPLQAHSYLSSKCSDNYMRGRVSNPVFAHVRLISSTPSFHRSLCRSDDALPCLVLGSRESPFWHQLLVPLQLFAALCCRLICDLPSPAYLPACLPACLPALLQFRQTLETVVRNGGASPKQAALVKTLREHFEVSGTSSLPAGLAACLQPSTAPWHDRNVGTSLPCGPTCACPVGRPARPPLQGAGAAGEAGGACGRVIVFTNFREGVMGICEALKQQGPLITAR